MESNMEIFNIDWSGFDGSPENTCVCNCGYVYRSHSKIKMHEGELHVVTRKKCYKCGRNVDNCSKIASDPERFTIE